MTRELRIGTAAVLLAIACIALLAGTLATGIDPDSDDISSIIAGGADDVCEPLTVAALVPASLVVVTIEPVALAALPVPSRSIVALAPKTSPPSAPRHA